MLNAKNKYIFIHVPKCGGTSIETLLGSNCEMIEGWDQNNKLWIQHCTILQLKQIYKIKVDEYFTFTFIRNPWDRAVSDYMHFTKPNSPFKHITKGSSLKDYLLCRNGYETINHLHNQRGRGDHFRSQYDYILDENQKPIINYIGRFENLQEDFNIVCDKTGIPRQLLPHKNKSKRKHYIEYYDEEAKQIVAEKYAKDIEYFGYKFGD